MQKRLAPRDSGTLIESIRYTIGYGGASNSGGDPDLTFNISAGGRKAPHAHLVEFGTRNVRVVNNYYGHEGVKAEVGAMPASPFFYPAYRALRARMKNRMARSARKSIRESIGNV